ncbi:MAG: hypothetical protein DRQ88_03405 [Epsilonproteobacteria bacterium]|nr:MAG: hypothetical protein DRQ89_01355 [Campylobacterota bacterium]RLA67366.1 MAG: hypothetical protein DRQ88_03405 [Campylobacterota bacterium]
MIFKTLVITFLIFNFGCSSPKERPVPKKRERRKVNYGPTIVDNSLFKDQTKEFGLGNITGSHFYAVDFDSDSLTDLVVLPDQYSSPQFYKFNNNKFEKLNYSPFEKIFPASFLSFADLDKDGVLDVLVGTFNQKKDIPPTPLKLFKGTVKNGKLKYIEVKNAFLKIPAYPTSSAVFLDFDLDGDLDLYMGNWFGYLREFKLPLPKGFSRQPDRPKLAMPDKFLKGEGFRFTDISEVLRGESKYSKDREIFLNAGPTLAVSTCDVDQNGYPDILTSSSVGRNNKLWLNLIDRKTGKRKYIDYGGRSGFAKTSAGGNSFFSLCGDYNRDLRFDIMSGEFNYYYELEKKDRSALLKNISIGFPPEFKRSFSALDLGRGNKSRSDRRGNFLDFNNDSLLDILIDDSGNPPGSRLYLLEQINVNKFKNISGNSGLNITNPSGTVLIDVNKDGKMDLITGQVKIRDSRIRPRVYLFINTSRDKNRSVRFYLRGRKSNIRGIGSLLVLTTSIGKQIKWVQASFGPTPSQNEEGSSFGIPKGLKLNQVTVKWPSKNSQAKVYSLKRYKFKKHLDFTLCESGKILVGRPKVNSCRL